MLKTRKIVAAIIISFLISLLLTACAELDTHSSLSRFQRSEKLYLSSMRWGEWSSFLYLLRAKPVNSGSEKIITITDPNTTKKYQVIEDQTIVYNKSADRESSTSKESSTDRESSTSRESQREELLAHLETIKVTHTETLGTSMSEAEGIGESRVLVEYHFDARAKINSIRYNVSWWYDEPSNTWFTDTPLPKELNSHRKTIRFYLTCSFNI